ncbi:hypothetical protein [Mycolicibacterium fortuitum]|uniref:hypothetical protein n=1 Tax=Mycolicibacterium fortuitum TaxID=1766 RepID=UPI001CE0E345|nr:hypothetical protein [Mycolicibacterium fortuitum]MCA4754807.1 hypothetical protein [Mycolicibacterium fortuitum]MDG5773940.1 hypothetical protein [Mycolicibacterium fortuitum]MDG5779674.1 hypothetical protein [Mycolicibacterium fortuitum]
MASREDYRGALEHWAGSSNPKHRYASVIGLWLLENTTVDNPLAASFEIIRATAKAELITVLKPDLDRYIEAVAERAACKVEGIGR